MIWSLGVHCTAWRGDRPPQSLFAGAGSGGERTAAMYSLIGTACLNGLDPEAYPAYALEHIADYPVNRIDEMLLMKAAQQLPDSAKIEPSR